MQPEQQWWAVTCGRGMERFAALEVAHKLQPLSVRPTDGKLHFLLPSAGASPPPAAQDPPAPSTSSASSPSSSTSPPAPAQGDQVLSRLRGLKTAERLFVQVLAHFEEEEGGEPAKDKSLRTIKSSTGANPFKIYEHGTPRACTARPAPARGGRVVRVRVTNDC
jgi:hypothetical protein